MPDPNRRLLAGTLILAPLGALLRSTPSVAQSPIVQPTEKTKAGFLEHARGLRDQAVREGDQAYGAVVVRNSIIVGEGRNFVYARTIQPRMPSCWPCAMPAGASRCATYPTVNSIQPPRPAPCVRRPSIGRASGVTTMTAPLLRAWLRASRVKPAKAALAAAAPIRPPAG